MLIRLGWRWDECGSKITLSGEGLVATRDESGYQLVGESGYQLVTGGSPMTEGRHYWEVELTRAGYGGVIFVGAARPGLDHDKGEHDGTSEAYYIDGGSGSLYGNGKLGTDAQGHFAHGEGSRDRIGVLLDLDAGWMRLYRNGKRCGPGFTEGVTGPLVRAAQLYRKGGKLTVLPGAAPPAGAGEEGTCTCRWHDSAGDYEV